MYMYMTYMYMYMYIILGQLFAAVGDIDLCLRLGTPVYACGLGHLFTPVVGDIGLRLWLETPVYGCGHLSLNCVCSLCATSVQ